MGQSKQDRMFNLIKLWQQSEQTKKLFLVGTSDRNNYIDIRTIADFIK